MGAAGPPLGTFMGIPGFEIILSIFHKLGFDPNLLCNSPMSFGMLLTVGSSIFTALGYMLGYFGSVTSFISANLVSSATVHSSDVTYLYLVRWLAANKVSTDCRLFWVTSRRNLQSSTARRLSVFGDQGNQHNDESDVDGAEGEDDSLGPKLKFSPAPGISWFWYNGKPIVIRRSCDPNWSQFVGDLPDQTMVLTTIGRSPKFLRDLLARARREYLEAERHKTTVYCLAPQIYGPSRVVWDQGRAKPSRDISTVFMPSEEKSRIINDCREYLSPGTAHWYARRGLPYRRGYLFYGPPGTGKTSLSMALAGELNLPLFILSLSTGSINDESLTQLFVGLPKKCIVLLEDIDCAGATDSSAKSNETSWGKKQKKDNKQPQPPNNDNFPRHGKTPVSFSGLLNAIDGVASHEGRILIMTTNHRERLDAALIRPGRVDMEIKLGFADAETITEVFRGLYQELETEKEGAEKVSCKARRFAELVPAGVFTPAEIQGFLLSYKGQPQKALEKVASWVEGKNRKKSGRNKLKLRRNGRNNPPPNIMPPSPPSTATPDSAMSPTSSLQLPEPTTTTAITADA
ncbi:P-loop containing nucleoside triphosphate hydrolase protein [Ascodesmis nigricans]|uniref:P-loop containing nucleoside triphosphate hydrolase protein n=1 Tax=Ascodesmis nigricans TaxID=341454 RepID=A0A4S2N3D2_9PEZI|nr:P-loop containing nucleoside triphosphate hydrolase protein [Ascodesmis nigricans]